MEIDFGGIFKMKNRCIIIALALCLMVQLTGCGVNATIIESDITDKGILTDNGLELDDVNTNIEIDYMAYIMNVLPLYDSSTDLQISQGFKVYGNLDENSRTFFVTRNGEYHALLVVTHVDGEFHSSYGLDDNEHIDNAIRNRESIALFALDVGAVFMRTEHGDFQITAFADEDDLKSQFPQVFEANYAKTEIILVDIS
jgi:hypothetical protein